MHELDRMDKEEAQLTDLGTLLAAPWGGIVGLSTGGMCGRGRPSTLP